jgi:hypothetical protein
MKPTILVVFAVVAVLIVGILSLNYATLKSNDTILDQATIMIPLTYFSNQ